MKNVFRYIILLILVSCNQSVSNNGGKIITVSIPPFKYFIDEIGGGDFSVNVMVASGSNPHIYEPVPGQIANLRKSAAYVSDGYLGFEMTWLDRFYETNRSMKKLSLGQNIDLIKHEGHSDSEHVEGADPHYWVSPQCALLMASAIKSLLIELSPEKKDEYELNYTSLIKTISDIDIKARELFSGYENKSFMIFHPTLGYLARDYGLKEIAVENEGKEPNPSSLRELIDIGRAEKIRVIFIQREYDTKNARAIAAETGAVLEIIDPLSENWAASVQQIIEALAESFKKKKE
ncbi:MAG: zinc ABC transporter substrate-binding protein [Odoribacter sp.]|nr:zinc ABC transporter substrate-binding protein [Odoribacter sp.]